MSQHLRGLRLPPQLNQRRDCVQRVEQEVRLQLHLQSLKLRGSELALQFQRFECIALSTDMCLNDSDDPECESVDQDLESEPIQIEHAREHLDRRSMRLPLGDKQAEAPEQYQMDNSRNAGEKDLQRDGRQSARQNRWRLQAGKP